VRIFAYEHVTGGGMAGLALPPGLLREADLMITALLDDLRGLPQVELLTTRDARLAPVPGIRTIPVRPTDDLRGILATAIDASNAVWPTAPETGGALEQVAIDVVGRGRILLGSRPDAVHIAASKLATARALRAAGIPAVETFALPDEIPPLPGRWVTKPDDGAGADAVLIVPDWRAARDRLAAGDGGIVAQPWIDGQAASLSLLSANGGSVLICINRQRTRVTENAVALESIEVNACADPSGELAALGNSIAASIPGLWGYVGVDLILSANGPRVLEVNPRLTTSYCGIGRALEVNIAARVLDLLQPGALARSKPLGPGTPVQLTLGPHA
jgi:predicted ATP-grasp superfamily ATP-dependent carboligase